MNTFQSASSFHTPTPDKRIRLHWHVVLVSLCGILFSTTAIAEQVVTAGGVYTIFPANTQCITETRGQEGALPKVEASCDTNTGQAEVTVASNSSLRALDMQANARFQKWISIAPTPDVPAQSLVPVHIRIPHIEWNFRLFNDVILEYFGRASANILLTVRENPTVEDPGIGNPAGRGKIIEQRRILAASHGGLGAGCLVSSMAAIAAGKPGPVVKCVASSAMKIEQEASVSLNVMLRAGTTYNIEIEVQGMATKKLNVPENLNFVSVKPPLANKPFMQWNKMVVSVATDPQAVIADLQKQIDELRYLLEHHTHEYLTGRGQGQNNTTAETSTLLIVPQGGTTQLSPVPDTKGTSSNNASPTSGGGSLGVPFLLFLSGFAVLRQARRRRAGGHRPDN